MEDVKVLVSPSVSELTRRVSVALSENRGVALVGPPGSGTTTVALLVRKSLPVDRYVLSELDCRLNTTWQEQLRGIEDAWAKEDAAKPRILKIDHAADLDTGDVDQLCRAVGTLGDRPVTAAFWVGSIDVRDVQQRCDIHLHSAPRTHFMLPELTPDELIQVYRTIAAARECAWGEALLYFMLDWCGDDLALVASAAEYFYGNW